MNPMEPFGKLLVTVGLIIVLMGLLLWVMGSHGGKLLPGDIAIEKGSFKFYFPVVTCLVLSLIFSILFSLFHK